MDGNIRLPIVIILCSLSVCFQSRNLALRKPARSDSVLRGFGNWSADKAVDGDRTQNMWCGSCLHTDTTGDGREAYLEIDLGVTSTIERVEIYYRIPNTNKSCQNGQEDQLNIQFASSRFKGYSIQITNSISSVTSTCYTDSSNPYPNLYQNNSCVGTGRHLTIVQRHITNIETGARRPVLELCEVEVYGCPIGYYGTACNRPCPNCINDLCNPDTGVCKEGCTDGWSGSHCNRACESGFHGRNCSIPCGNCFDNLCRTTDGLCKQGCVKGYDGTQCSTACSSGRYGYNCNMTCGRCLNNQSCDKETGICPNKDCEKGYTGLLCNEMCNPGTFGRNCDEKCGRCKFNTVCNHVTGYCESGCSDGWTGNGCQTACKAGYYGATCIQQCSGHCYRDRPCHHENGSCLQGCANGYQGSACKNVCSDGSYGVRCSEPCSKNCYSNTTCHHVNGNCQHGCTDGFRGPTCSEANEQKATTSNNVLSGILGTCAALGIAAAVLILIIRKRKRNQGAVSHEYEMPGQSYESVYEVLDDERKTKKGSRITKQDNRKSADSYDYAYAAPDDKRNCKLSTITKENKKGRKD